MKKNHFNSILLAVFILIPMAFSGCSTPKSASTTLDQPTIQNGASTDTIEQANRLMQQGRRDEAAEMYFRNAFSYPSPQRERIILQAAEISASQGNLRSTENYLSKVRLAAISREQQSRYRYIQALMALQQNQPAKALKLLPTDLRGISAGLRDKVELVRQSALSKTHSAGIRTPETRTPVRPPPGTAAVPQPQQPHYQSTPVNPTQQRQPLPTAINKIAALLPGSGAMGKVADEIYQGMQATSNGTTIQRYTVDKNNVLSEYQKAVAEGADIVLGPLDKDALTQLTRQATLLTRPILSLNYLENNQQTPNSLYQFGLSPEDEARQVANFALNRGQTTGIVLAPDSSWGKRLASAFATSYEQRGGRVLHREYYPNNSPSSYLSRVQTALARASNATMVFLAASPTQARLLRPLLQDQAGLLPVYATSHIFSGRQNSSQDIDLDGIIYTEIPLILDKSAQSSLDSFQYPRLYALGMDAVMIAKNLPKLTQNQSVPGKTGEVRVNAKQEVQRLLDFATFINGQPHPLGN